MEVPDVAAIVPVFGRRPLLREAVRSLLDSVDAHVQVVLVDVTPEAGRLPSFQPAPVTTLVEPRAGFAGAINAGVARTSAPLVLFGNDDLVVGPTYVAELAAALRRRPRAAVVGGKVVRADPESGLTSGTIDTAGVTILRSRRPANRGEGEPDDGRFDDEREVFAISGAGLLARRDALGEASLSGQPLDEAFFMYKEDVDLAWRLRLLGWECWYVPSAVARHARTSRSRPGGFLRHPRERLAAERTKPHYVRLHSMKNQWLLLTKNEQLPNLARDAPWIVAREACVLAYNAVTSPRTLAAVPLFLAALPNALAARRSLMRRRRVSAGEVRRAFR